MKSMEGLQILMLEKLYGRAFYPEQKPVLPMEHRAYGPGKKKAVYFLMKTLLMQLITGKQPLD